MTATNNNNGNLTPVNDNNQPIIIEKEVTFNSVETPNSLPRIAESNAKMRHKKWGIRAKATLLAMAIGTLPVMAVGGIAYTLANQSINRQIDTFEKTNVTQLQDKIHVYMKDRFSDIQAMASLDIFTNPKWRETATREEKDAALTKMLKAYGIYDSIAVFDIKGNVIAQTAGTPLKNHIDRTYIQAALKINGPVLSQPSISTTEGTFNVYAASTLKDPTTGEPIGFIRARMPVKFLEKIIDNYKTEGQTFYLINGDRQIFLGPEGEYVVQTLSSGKAMTNRTDEYKAIDAAQIFPIIEQLEQQNKANVIPGQNLKAQTEQLLAYAPPIKFEGLPDLNWRAIIATDADIVFASQRQLRWLLLLGTAATSLIVGIIAVIVANRATRPILQSSQVVKRLGEGDFAQRVQVVGDDEIAQLGSDINTMAQQIQELLIEQQAAAQREKEDQAAFARQQGELAEQERERSEKLQRELIKLLTEVEGASEGDLTVRAEISAGEIGIVADFFNSIVESLRDVVSQVKQTATQVNSSITTNEGSIRQLASEAIAQASQITQTLNSVEEMTQSIQVVADNAKAAAAVAKTASTTAEMGGADMEQTVANIFQLRDTVAETTKKVKRLGESSQQISKVVSLINQIALQTNLLAINASIEAARAGEEGRGFAVVAEEVGQLAAQSAAATKEIEKIVETIRQETSAVVEAMELGTTQVVEGTRLAEKTKASLGQIVEVSRQIDQLLESISQATVSQANTSQSVTQLMEEVAKVSQKTSDSSRQVSGSLQETVAIANQLQASVGTFKVS
ncbi:methyl-accepting chemotaxis protein [Crocosphaera sp. UHCC 0190]|uniref:methyl-accepting chemotaxis protein n=1 Tax=Crocosphaera sp. UHCC 0190 TaxID=3110246 RepID=UPI002B1F7FD9|nr:methyl-accepting chemotaxis protein [Crocosphaera sp. UHCC 0190]MEA5511451.1 methyl-accepting chemotaxis protein [Crocosphaera sp. UHCC 0190]